MVGIVLRLLGLRAPGRVDGAPLRRALAASRSVASRAGFLTLFFAFSIAQFVLTPVGNAVSRHFEHEADVYGQEAIHGLVPDPQKTAVSSFNHLGEAWLEDPNPNAFVEFWSYSHPSVQRARRVCRALRSVGERRAWGVFHEIGIDARSVNRSLKLAVAPKSGIQ